MKVLPMAIIAVLAASAAGLWGAPPTPLTVCLSPGAGKVSDFYSAEQIAAEILAPTGFAIAWKTSSKACVNGGIIIRILAETPSRQYPGALAYALPYKGNEIVLFYDRVSLMFPNSRDALPRLLGHVIAHEIAHLLQGIVRHSASGLLKPFWTDDDIYRMRRALMPLAPEDIDLIQHQGDRTSARLAASKSNPELR